MKIYDCFQYFNEDIILDLRLNILSEQVNFFLVVEYRFILNYPLNINFLRSATLEFWSDVDPT